MSRAAVEYIKTHKQISAHGKTDPLRPEAKLDGYTIVANGVLLSSYLAGAVGKYCHFVVGRGSDHDDERDENGVRRPPYFRYVIIRSF